MEDARPALASCWVPAPLGLLLQASRALGLAPLSFHRARGGWRISVSLLYSFYSKALFCLYVVLTTMAVWTDLTVDLQTSFKVNRASRSIPWLFDIYAVMIVVKATPHVHRMHEMIAYLGQLDQINKKLNRYNPSCSDLDSKSWTVIYWLIFASLFVLSSYASFMYKVVNINGKVVTSSLYVCYYLLHISLLVLTLQFATVTTRLRATTRRLNSCLKSLLHDNMLNRVSVSTLTEKNKEGEWSVFNEIVKESVRHGEDSRDVKRGIARVSVPATLRALTRLFGALCDVKQAQDDADAPMLVAMITSIQIHLIITTYNFFSELIGTNDLGNIFGIMMQLLWALLHFGKLLTLIEPAHRTSEEMETTRRLFTRLRRHARAHNAALSAEIKLFCQHFALYPVAYVTRLEYDLTRPLIVSILSSITLYLNILINLN